MTPLHRLKRIGKQRQTTEQRNVPREEPQMSEQQPTINETQQLYFDLFKRVQYNLLDGQRVVADLLAWRELWYSVLPVRLPDLFPNQDDKQNHPYTEVSMLRTLRFGDYPFDTLYIWTTDQALPLLRRRIEERWEASEVAVLTPETDEEMRLAHLDDAQDRVLFVWWD